MKIIKIDGREIPAYNRDPGLLELAEMVRKKMELQETVVVAIAGGSASGKTSAIAAKLRQAFEKIALLYSIDDYYFGIEYMKAHCDLNWDQPQAVNLELFARQLAELKSGKSIKKPIYKFATGRSEGFETLHPHRLIIIEGLFALDDTIGDLADIKVFVDIEVNGRIIRRILRDIERTGQKPADILKQFADTVQPMHDLYIETTKGNADIVINNEYVAEVEAGRANLFEVQLKFPVTFDSEALRKIGAERLGMVLQTDIYYNPRDRDLRGTGESLRIRNENGRYLILTYKGPQVKGSEFRKRPKIEFQIDQGTEEKFLAIYGTQSKRIIKERVLYVLDGVIFSIDKVMKFENDHTSWVGEFLEIRAVTKNDSPKEEIKNVLGKLGLDISKGIKKSYVEM